MDKDKVVDMIMAARATTSTDAERDAAAERIEFEQLIADEPEALAFFVEFGRLYAAASAE